MKNMIRRLSSSVRWYGKDGGLQPVFKSRFLGEGVKSFDKNLPIQRDIKPWDQEKISKDEYFMRKYGSISPQKRDLLNRKVERQRRARELRRESDKRGLEIVEVRDTRDTRDTRITENLPRRKFRDAFKNPLVEYIYGTHPVLAALSGNKRELFNKLLIYNPKDDFDKISQLAKKYGIQVVKKDSKGELNMVTDNGVHNGVVLETKSLDLPVISELGVCDPTSGNYDLCLVNELYNTEISRVKQVVRDVDASTSNKFPLGIYLDEITDPHNIGAIVRSAYYLGVDFIVVPDHDSAKLGPVASKASAGAIDLIDIYKTDDSLQFVSRAKANGWNVIATSAKPSATGLKELKGKHHKVQHGLRQKFVAVEELSTILNQSPILLVMGSEGDGVRTHLKLKSDYLVGLDKKRAVPDDIVDSLNVSVASALLISKCFD